MPETPDTPVEKPEGTPNVPVTPDTPVEKPEEAPDVSEIPGSSDETSDNTNSNNETNKNPEKLPSTGNVLSNYVVVLGSLLLVALVLIFKKIKFKGSK